MHEFHDGKRNHAWEDPVNTISLTESCVPTPLLTEISRVNSAASGPGTLVMPLLLWVMSASVLA
jgi:hypothetical protein